MKVLRFLSRYFIEIDVQVGIDFAIFYVMSVIFK